MMKRHEEQADDPYLVQSTGQDNWVAGSNIAQAAARPPVDTVLASDPDTSMLKEDAAGRTSSSRIGGRVHASEINCNSGSEDALAPLGLAFFPSKPSRDGIRRGRRMLRKGVLLLTAFAVMAAVAVLLGSDILSWDLQAIRSRVMPASRTATSVREVGAPVRVSVARVRAEDVPIYLSGIGTVQAYSTVNVTTRVDGQITQILFQEGQDVKQDDPLVIIDPRPYQALLEQQQAILRKDQAVLSQAIANLKRYEALAPTKAIPAQQIDDQRYLVEQAQAQVKLDEAQVSYAKTQVEYTTIRAPISGRTGIRQVDQGNNVYAALNTTIVVITQLRPISVIFTFPARDVAAGKLTLGQTRFPVAAYDDKTPLDIGTVDLVDNVIDPTTGNVKLKASFPNEKLRLWPGDFVNGRVTVETRRQGLTVPPTALRHGPRGDYVWIVGGDNVVRAQLVRVRQTADARILVDGNIRPGQRVVTEGHFLLENDKRVEIIESGPGASRAGSSEALPKTELRSEADAK